jgi:hypothetical protein
MVIRFQPDTDVPATGAVPPASRIARIVAMLTLVVSPFSIADDSAHTGWWLDAGFGGGSLSAGHGTVATGGGGVWIDVTLGAHVNDRWLMGLELGGLGMHPSNSNCGCSNPYSNNYSIYGEAVTHTLLAVRYEPRADHGWVWGLATGPAFYSNQTLEALTGNYHSGNGWAGMATVGYDWKVGQGSTHVEAIVNVEQGHISLNSPLVGQFDYSTVAASVHVAMH